MLIGDYTNKKTQNKCDILIEISIELTIMLAYFTSNPVKIMLLMELRTKTKVVKSNFFGVNIHTNP
jgi:hypothetical protein